MRFPAFVLALALLASPALSETVKATDAASHIGQSVTVEGFVSNVFASRVPRFAGACWKCEVSVWPIG